jgi:holo-[acyl-carrier protein] synthase
MKLATGVDLVEIQRLEAAIQRHGDRFLQRIFTSQELQEVKGNLPSLAGRFAAKEAVAKALGTGIGAINWREVEVLRGAERQPVLHLHGAASLLAEELSLRCWSLSLSHTFTHAVAMVVALGEEEDI